MVDYPNCVSHSCRKCGVVLSTEPLNADYCYECSQSKLEEFGFPNAVEGLKVKNSTVNSRAQ